MTTRFNLVACILTLGCLVASGSPATSRSGTPQSEIPFVVTNQKAVSQCIRCAGPRFRDTGLQEVRPLASMQEIFSARVAGMPPFGSARVTDLSPFGGWTCRRMKFDADMGQCTSEPVDATEFCLREGSKSASVALTIGRAGALGTNQPRSCSTDSASVAFLGNQRRSAKPDKDTYLFTANAGNRVIAFLEPDANRKNSGKSAVLSLIHKNATTGSKFKEVVRGTVPLRIEATVPETGTYEIVVAQSNKKRAASFRGFYRLSTRANILAPQLNIDQDAIEPVADGDPVSPQPSDAGCYSFSIQAAELAGALEVKNETEFSILIKISRGGDVLNKGTTILPYHNIFIYEPDDTDKVLPVSSPPPPFTIDLKASENGTFVGSSRIQLQVMANLLIPIVGNAGCG